MAAGEFQLIDRYLGALGARRDDVALAVGDDAALLAPPAGARLITACAGGDAGGDAAGGAEALAGDCYRRAASALRAAGAEPRWATVALTLSDADEPWVAAFARALDRACRADGVQVVGGDTTAGISAATVFLVGCPAP